MSYRTEAGLAAAAAHGVTLKRVGVMLGCWALLIGFARVALPIQYPYEALGEMIDTGLVVGLVLPLTVSVSLLDEGPVELLSGVARTLALYRLASCALYGAAVAALSCLAALTVRVSMGLLVGDAMFLGAVAVIGVSTLGPRLGWTPLLAVALVASAPTLIPWQANWLYRRGQSAELVPVTLALFAVGSFLYAHFGSAGVLAQRRLRVTGESQVE
jgi:hypothetical protein